MPGGRNSRTDEVDFTFSRPPPKTRLRSMPLDHEKPPGIRRIEDIQAAFPRESTLQNLLQLSNEKLETCGRLAIYAYEANREGFAEAADLFARLSANGRTEVEQLLTTLQRHLEATAAKHRPDETTASNTAA
jgi:hypothetical protein